MNLKASFDDVSIIIKDEIVCSFKLKIARSNHRPVRHRITRQQRVNVYLDIVFQCSRYEAGLVQSYN